MPDHKQRLLDRAASLYDLHGCDAVRVVELLRTANNGTMLQAEVARELTHVVATRVICATLDQGRTQRALGADRSWTH